VTLPDSLPQRIFLLACDPAKGRVAGGNLGAMLRAGALCDLHRGGHLTDAGGRVAVQNRRPGHDAVLDALLDEITGSRPRKWKAWIGRRQGPTVKAVRQQLADGGWVRLQPHRILGLFPTTKVTVRDPRVRTELLGRVDRALHRPLSRVDPADVALVAFVAAGELKLVLDRAARRTHKRRIQEVMELSAPVGPALRRSIQEAAAASAAG
jgi:hypothetical protein